ncbi:MAG TPA: NAD-dependent deacetylase [Campylobacteraceae bacterium]|nr:NAD-dependent deacetylase [Campylobacteraceae bacterium]
MDRAQEILRDADAVLITAGAGMGVDSGLPDFRGSEGFWRAYPVIKDLGYRFEEMADPVWFEKDPTLAWAFYGHRYKLYSETTPHAGFSRLLAYAAQKPGSYFVFTSNVDGQFQKAGYDPNRIVEIHGSIHHMQCNLPCTRKIVPAKGLDIAIDPATFRTTSPLPRCSDCGAIMRPNILMFGDWHWIPDRTDAQSHALQRWLDAREARREKIAVLELGAGKAVPTVRIFSEQIAQNYDASLIRINPHDHDVPHGAIGIASGAREAIETLLQGVNDA